MMPRMRDIGEEWERESGAACMMCGADMGLGVGSPRTCRACIKKMESREINQEVHDGEEDWFRFDR